MATTSLTPWYVGSKLDRDLGSDVPPDKEGSKDPSPAPVAANASNPDRRGFGEELRFVIQEWRNRELSPTESRNRKKCLILSALALLLTGLSVLIASLRKIEDTKYGIEYNVHKKQLDDAAKSGGLFLGPPGYEVCSLFVRWYEKTELNGHVL
jgi:hypothetical protein